MRQKCATCSHSLTAYCYSPQNHITQSGDHNVSCTESMQHCRVSSLYAPGDDRQEAVIVSTKGTRHCSCCYKPWRKKNYFLKRAITYLLARHELVSTDITCEQPICFVPVTLMARLAALSKIAMNQQMVWWQLLVEQLLLQASNKQVYRDLALSFSNPR